MRLQRLLVTATLVAGFVGLSPAAAHAVDPDRCRGSGGGGYLSCTGKDPQAMGCSAGASTVKEGRAANGAWVELRHSSFCRAYWTRYLNEYGATGQARIYGGNVTFTKTLAAYDGETGWTKMVASSLSNPRACMWMENIGEYCPRE